LSPDLFPVAKRPVLQRELAGGRRGSLSPDLCGHSPLSPAQEIQHAGRYPLSRAPVAAVHGLREWERLGSEAPPSGLPTRSPRPLPSLSALSPERVADARDRASSVDGGEAQIDDVGFCSAAGVLAVGRRHREAARRLVAMQYG
jgi:hypothetical protein